MWLNKMNSLLMCTIGHLVNNRQQPIDIVQVAFKTQRGVLLSPQLLLFCGEGVRQQQKLGSNQMCCSLDFML